MSKPFAPAQEATCRKQERHLIISDVLSNGEHGIFIWLIVFVETEPNLLALKFLEIYFVSYRPSTQFLVFSG